MKRIQIDSVQAGDILFTARPEKINNKQVFMVFTDAWSHQSICRTDARIALQPQPEHPYPSENEANRLVASSMP